ncbi:hypothetical protein LQ50_04965 [Halalkalibacter okhensis]|uniref:Uncharacterized protein n=1 Tax=Halalkalibacter okhensis TaxID=333138 RepID=A0A0B0IM19_9BACI|nr:hypothetical protein LQ50_04965 [Halalkalibacter okhensis]
MDFNLPFPPAGVGPPSRPLVERKDRNSLLFNDQKKLGEIAQRRQCKRKKRLFQCPHDFHLFQ